MTTPTRFLYDHADFCVEGLPDRYVLKQFPMRHLSAQAFGVRSPEGWSEQRVISDIIIEVIGPAVVYSTIALMIRNLQHFDARVREDRDW